MYHSAKRVITISLTLLFSGAVLQAQKIHEAAAAGDLDIVRKLIESDPAIVNSKDEGGNTALHMASAYAHFEIAKFLLDHHADINSKNNYGFTPLLRACGGRNPEVSLVKYLVEKGADVNAQLDRGLTALHFAAMTGKPEIVRFLIDRGIELNTYDHGCYGTALHIAINLGGNEKVVKMLLEAGAELMIFSFGNSELHLAAIRGYANLIGMLAEHGADVNLLNDYKHTPVYYAARHGFQGTVKVLLDAGADKNSIVETNVGHAKELGSELNENEAWLWYLGGLYGQGYAVKTKSHLLVFDKIGTEESPESGLANGKLNPTELEGQDITVLITKANGLKHEPVPFEIAEKLPETKLIIDPDPVAGKLENSDFSTYKIAIPNESLLMEGLKVHSIPAFGEGYGGSRGLGYIVEADGLKIYHSGFHASGYTEREEFRKEIDRLKPFAPIDIAILTVAGHLPVGYLPYLYLIDQLSPGAVYLMGGDQVTEEYIKCLNILKDRDVPVFYPEAGISTGESFHYMRDQILIWD